MAYLDENGLEHFWGKIKDRVSSAVAPKANDADVVHKTGDETLEGMKTFQNTAPGHAAGQTVTDFVLRNPMVVRGTPVAGGNSYTRVLLADKEGDTEESYSGRLGLLEVQSPKEDDADGERLNLLCYRFREGAGGASTGLRVGYDIDGIPYATVPATSADRTNPTDIVTRGYMEASEWNWQKTKKAAMVLFKPVPESGLEPVVDFAFTETPPASGDKAPDNPSTITGAAAVEIGRCGKNLLVYPYIENSHTYSGGLTATANSDGSVKYNGTGSTSNQFFSVTDGNSSGAIPCKIELAPGAQYTFSLKLVSGNVSDPSNIRLAIVDHDAGAYIGTCTIGASRTFTATNRHFRARLEVLANVSFSNVVVAPQLELGSAATPFEPYSGNEYTIQLGDTYYGGSLDVATGVMTVTWKGFALDGTEDDWVSFVPFGGFYAAYSQANRAIPKNNYGSGGISSHFIYGTSGDVERFYITNTGDVCLVTEYSDKASLKAWLAAQYANGTPVTVAYEIATPFTVQLTPTQIRSLPALDKYAPRINTVYTDQEAVQVGYQRFFDENRLAAIEARLDALEGN